MPSRPRNTDAEPDLEIGDLRLWVHDREFPEAQDYWDGNWLQVTARYVTGLSSVEVSGPYVRVNEIDTFLGHLRGLYQSLKGQAKLDCLEPELAVELIALTGGRIRVTIEITPDHLNESHRFISEFDQTYLPPIIAQCHEILERFPMRGAEELGR